jgi:hypothetical protein
VNDQTSFLEQKSLGQRVERFRVPYRGHAPFAKRSETSEAAAVAIEPRRGTLQWKVHRFVRSRGHQGATRQEIADLLGIAENTVRPRITELIALGLVRKTDRTRETRAGRSAEILVSHEQGAA